MSIIEQLPVSNVLTPKQERGAAPEALVMSCIKEAVLYTRKCSYGKIPDDALLSLCYDTMLKSARIFRPGGIRFFAYCKARLRGAVKDYWTGLETVRNAETVSLDTPIAGRGFKKLHDRHIHSRTRDYHPDKPNPNAQLEDEAPPTVAELIGGTAEPEFEKMFLSDTWGLVSEAARKVCTDEERTVLYLVYKLQFSFEEAGELLDISRQYASVTAKKAIAKIRRAIGNRATI